MGKPIEIKIVNRAAQGQALRRPDDAAPERGRDPGADARPGLERGAGSRPRAAAGTGTQATCRGWSRARARRRRRRRSARTTCSARRPTPCRRSRSRRPGRPAGRGAVPPATAAAARPRRRRRAPRHVPQHPRPEHDRRRPRPQRSVPQPLVRRHRHRRRGGPHRPVHGRRRRPAASRGSSATSPSTRRTSTSSTSPARSTTSSTARPSAAAARSSGSTSSPARMINRFQVSLREPYLFDLPIGAGVAGYWFSRIYPNWDERRGGGRFSLGRQFGTQHLRRRRRPHRGRQLLRLPRPPPPPTTWPPAGHIDPVLAPARASGSTTATTRSWPPRASTPSSPSSKAGARSPGPSSTPRGGPTSPTGSRPDGTGKRFFTFRGHFGIADPGDIPVYERLLRRQLRQPSRLPVPHRQPPRPGRAGRRHHDGRRLGRVPVPLDRQRHVPPGHLHRLRHGRGRLQLHTSSASRSAPASAC